MINKKSTIKEATIYFSWLALTTACILGFVGTVGVGSLLAPTMFFTWLLGDIGIIPALIITIPLFFCFFLLAVMAWSYYAEKITPAFFKLFGLKDEGVIG